MTSSGLRLRELVRRPGMHRRLLVTLLVLVAWRLLAQMVAPGVDPARAGHNDVSIVAVGLRPYAIALVLVVLGQVISTTVSNQRDRLWRWTRWLEAGLALAQARAVAMSWCLRS